MTILVLLWWLVLRLELGAGLITWRGDRAWRDLTALDSHHETQPMPGPLSRWFHLLPRPLHRVEVAANHLTQLVVPFLLLVPGPVASGAAALVVVTQLWLVLSGNFAWLNWLTIVLACSAITDDAFTWASAPLGVAVPATAHGPTPLWFVVVVLVVTALCVVLSWWPARNLLSRRQRMNASFNPWHLVNAYGAFGSISRSRTEIVVEGTLDEEPDETARWQEYEFRGKPGDVHRRPGQYAPYHLRLDWGMWFLGLGSRAQLRWFMPFLARLLEADRPTLRLLAHDPFDGERPRWVRARRYDYRFATHAEHRATGQTWVREDLGVMVDARSLRSSAPGR